MEAHVIREEQSSNKRQYRRFRSEPRWLIIGGLILAVFSTLAYFVAQVVFAILTAVGVVIAIWGLIQWVLSLFSS